MSTRKTKQIEVGCRAVTNELFASQIGLPRVTMTVIKTDKSRKNCWVVRWDGIRPLQYVHQKFIERIEQ